MLKGFYKFLMLYILYTHTIECLASYTYISHLFLLGVPLGLEAEYIHSRNEPAKYVVTSFVADIQMCSIFTLQADNLMLSFCFCAFPPSHSVSTRTGSRSENTVDTDSEGRTVSENVPTNAINVCLNPNSV